MLSHYIILIGYFLILFIIGILASKKVKNLADYYVGGKALNYWVVAFSSRATGESAWLLLGLTGMGAAVGFSAFWVVIGEVLGVGAAWFFMAKRFKTLTDKYKSITIPDFLSSHFKDTKHHIRMVAAGLLTIFIVIYVSAQIDATGKAFEAFMNWNYYVGFLVGFFIILAYIFFGGFIAVVWSDVFQGALMMIGLVALPLIGFYYIGSFQEVYTGLKDIDMSLVSFWGKDGFNLYTLTSAIGLLAIGLGFLGSPQVFVRFMSIKNEKEIDKGRWVAITFTFLTDASAVLIGILGRYLFTKQGDVVNEILGNTGQNVLYILVHHLLPTFLVGFYVAAVLAAIMSTIDSLLVVGSSAIARDFYQKIIRPDYPVDQLPKLSRKATLIMAFLALAIALVVAIFVPNRTIFWFIIFGWSGIAAMFCPMIILSLFWKNYTKHGALASMIVGFLAIPIFKFLMPQIPDIGIYFENMAELFPAFICSLLAGWIFSKYKF